MSLNKENLSFDALPGAVIRIHDRLESIERAILKNNQKEDEAKFEDRWFNIDELCDYMPDKPAKATIYGLTSRGEIPFHKGGKKLRFLRSEINQWLMAGKKMIWEEIPTDASEFLGKRKG